MGRYVVGILLVLAVFAVAQHQHHDMSAMPQSGPAAHATVAHDGADAQQAQSADAMDPAMPAMQHRHNDMGPHMKLTSMRTPVPEDRQRADAIVQEGRKVMERYADYREAMADGYRIFLPKLPQKMYHFTNYRYAVEAAFGFDADHPTSLLYEKTGENSWKLIGLMYTAPARSSMEELDSRVPLSIAQWHEHTNFCAAPRGRENEYFGKNPKFGLLGSIWTKEECDKAGGTFRPQIFGWMVHVYPNEKTQDAIWSVERQMEHHHGD